MIKAILQIMLNSVLGLSLVITAVITLLLGGISMLGFFVTWAVTAFAVYVFLVVPFDC